MATIATLEDFERSSLPTRSQPAMSESEFNSGLPPLIGGRELPSPIAVDEETDPPGPISVAPATEQALSQASKEYGEARQPSATKSEWEQKIFPDFATKLGAERGIPFDTKSGIPFLARFKMAFQPTAAEEQEALSKVYPGGVRRNAFGDLVVRKTGPDGKVVDVLADPLGVDLGDIPSVIPAALETAGGAALALSVGGPALLTAGFVRALAFGGLAAAGSGVTGGIMDTATRALSDHPLDFGETALRRGVTFAAIDMPLTAIAGGVGKSATKIISPFAKPGQRQLDAVTAQQYIKQRTGITVDLTPAELTGAGLFYKGEALAQAYPGSAMVFDKMMQNRFKQLEEVRTIMLGGAVPDEDTMARKAYEALGGKIFPLQAAEKKAGFEAGKAAQTEIKETISNKIGLSTAEDRSALGSELREAALADRDSFYAEFSGPKGRYPQLYADPRLAAKNIPIDPLAREADVLIEKLPTYRNVVGEIDYDAYGSPIEKMATKKQPVDEFIPSGVVGKLRRLSEGRGQEMRLDELISMRTEVDNQIAVGEATPGVKTHFLNEVRDVLTKQIKTGLGDIDQGLLNTWETLTQDYRKGIQRYARTGIAQLFRSPEQLNWLGDTAIVNRATSGSGAQDFYKAYKEFYGSNNPLVTRLHRAVADEVLGLNPLTDTIQGNSFVKNLTGLAHDSPKLFDDVFGTSGKELLASGRILKQVQGGNLPQEELVEAINSGKLSGQHLYEMLVAQETKDRAYNNSIIKSVGEGTLNPRKLSATKLVDTFVFKSSPEDLTDLIVYLADEPEILEGLRRLTFKRVLDDATKFTKTGDRLVDADELETILLDPIKRKQINLAITPRGIQDLEAVRDVLKPATVREKQYAGTGSMGTSAQIAALFFRGHLKTIEQSVRNWLTAAVYTSPTVRNYFSNTAIPKEDAAKIVRIFMASTPMIQNLVKDFTKGKARSIAYAASDALNKAEVAGLPFIPLPGQQMPAQRRITNEEEFEKNTR